MFERKNFQIEYIRAIAAIGVVSIHTIFSGILYSGDDTIPYVVICFTMLKNMLYWAVPCFGMISGILLLNPEKELSLKKIYGKYLVRIVAVLLLFGVAFSWMEIMFYEHTISIKQIPSAVLLVVTHQTWAHLWYLYALLTIYFVLPLWRYIAKRSNNLFLIGFICLLYVLAVVFNSNEISLHMFFMMGELYRRQYIKADKKVSAIGFMLCSAVNLGIAYINEVSQLNLNRFLGYTSIFVAAQAYFVFSFLYDTDFGKYGAGIRDVMLRLSQNSFGIYLIHMFFVNLEYKVFKFHLMNSIFSLFIFLILIIVNVTLSYFATEIIRKVPGLKRLI